MCEFRLKQTTTTLQFYELIQNNKMNVLLGEKGKHDNNNKLVQVLSFLVLLSIWLRVRFKIYVYRKNSIGRRKFILCVPQILQWRLVIVNSSRNFVPIS
jgi:hypothetical protein